jgi:hypothetical protein
MAAVLQHLFGGSAEPLLDRDVDHPVSEEKEQQCGQQGQSDEDVHQLALEAAPDLPAPAVEVELDQIPAQHRRENEQCEDDDHRGRPQSEGHPQESGTAHGRLTEEDLRRDQG